MNYKLNRLNKYLLIFLTTITILFLNGCGGGSGGSSGTDTTDLIKVNISFEDNSTVDINNIKPNDKIKFSWAQQENARYYEIKYWDKDTLDSAGSMIIDNLDDKGDDNLDDKGDIVSIPMLKLYVHKDNIAPITAIRVSAFTDTHVIASSIKIDLTTYHPNTNIKKFDASNALAYVPLDRLINMKTHVEFDPSEPDKKPPTQSAEGSSFIWDIDEIFQKGSRIIFGYGKMDDAGNLPKEADTWVKYLNSDFSVKLDQYLDTTLYDTVRRCRIQGKDDYSCHNHMLNGYINRKGQLHLFGSHAYSPKRYIMPALTKDNGFSIEPKVAQMKKGSGIALVPWDFQALDRTMDYSHTNGSLMTGAIFTDFIKSSPVIYREKIEEYSLGDIKYSHTEKATDREDIGWLDLPLAVSIFSFGGREFNLFDEIAIEYQQSRNKRFNRISSICKQDRGAGLMDVAKKKWRTYNKTKIDCGFQTGFEFPHNNFSLLISADRVGDKLVSLWFSPAAAKAGICIYDMNTIVKDDFTFPLSFQYRTSTGVWAALPKDQDPLYESNDPKVRQDLINYYNCTASNDNYYDSVEETLSQYQLHYKSLTKNGAALVTNIDRSLYPTVDAIKSVGDARWLASSYPNSLAVDPIGKRMFIGDKNGFIAVYKTENCFNADANVDNEDCNISIVNTLDSSNLGPISRLEWHQMTGSLIAIGQTGVRRFQFDEDFVFSHSWISFEQDRPFDPWTVATGYITKSWPKRNLDDLEIRFSVKSLKPIEEDKNITFNFDKTGLDDYISLSSTTIELTSDKLAGFITITPKLVDHELDGNVFGKQFAAPKEFLLPFTITSAKGDIIKKSVILSPN